MGNNIVKGAGGGLPGGGRTPKALQMKNYEKAIKMLDDNVEEILGVLIDGLHDPDKYYRFNCAAVLLKKIIPDKKIKQVVGEGGGPVKFEITDKRANILEIVGVLDSMGMDEMKRRFDDAGERIFDAEYRTEEGEEEEVADGTGTSETGEE